MSKYYFNVLGTAGDADGMDLADIDAARIEAVRLSGELLKEAAGTFWESCSWELQVSDETERVIFALVFSVKDEPAL